MAGFWGTDGLSVGTLLGEEDSRQCKMTQKQRNCMVNSEIILLIFFFYLLKLLYISVFKKSFISHGKLNTCSKSKKIL